MNFQGSELAKGPSLQKVRMDFQRCPFSVQGLSECLVPRARFPPSLPSPPLTPTHLLMRIQRVMKVLITIRLIAVPLIAVPLIIIAPPPTHDNPTDYDPTDYNSARHTPHPTHIHTHSLPPSQGPYPFMVMRWLCRLSSRSAAGDMGRLPPCWVLSLSATSCLDRKAS